MPRKRKDLKIEGASLWYFVGLIASDGCLSKDGRHVDITAKDKGFLEELKLAFGFQNKIGVKYGYNKNRAYHMQISNKNFYNFLVSVGLTKNKSLVIGALKIPNLFFVDFLRGVIDGDGSIRSWMHPTNFGEQWSLRIYSGSKIFLEWLSGNIKYSIESIGRLHLNKAQGTVYVLKFGKMAAIRILKKCYYKNCISMSRKNTLAERCVNSRKGWKRSKTLLS